MHFLVLLVASLLLKSTESGYLTPSLDTFQISRSMLSRATQEYV